MRKLWILLAVLCAVNPCGADDLKTARKKLPAIAAAPLERPKKADYDRLFGKWGVEAWWSIQYYQGQSRVIAGVFIPGETYQVGNGFVAAFCSPEMVAGITSKQAKHRLMSDVEAQELWKSNLAKLTGDRMAFVGYVQVNNQVAGAKDVAKGHWIFQLVTSKGTKIKPLGVEIESTSQVPTGITEDGTSQAEFTVIFPGTDPETGRPLLEAGTRDVTLAAGSDWGAAAARYEFTLPKK